MRWIIYLLLWCGVSHIGEVAHSDGGVKQYNNRTIFLTPLLRNYRFFGLSPIFCVAKHRGEGAIPTAVTKLSPPLSLPCPVALQGAAKQHVKSMGTKHTARSRGPKGSRTYAIL